MLLGVLIPKQFLSSKPYGSIFQRKTGKLPWSLKAEIGFVLDFSPVAADTVMAIESEVTSEM